MEKYSYSEGKRQVLEENITVEIPAESIMSVELIWKIAITELDGPSARQATVALVQRSRTAAMAWAGIQDRSGIHDQKAPVLGVTRRNPHWPARLLGPLHGAV